MRRLLAPLVVGLATALAIPLTAVSAHAATLRIADPRGDVVTAVVNDNFDVVEQPAAAGAGPDVTSLSIAHNRRNVVLRMTFAGLARPTGDQAVGAVLRLHGSNQQRRVVQVIAVPDLPFGRQSVMVRERNEKRVCPQALRSSIDYRAQTLTVSFPRRCLGAPARLRVAGAAYSVQAADLQSAQFNVDDALREGGSIDSIATRFSPWVKRG